MTMPLQRRNKWTVLLLCLFLGRFGVHRFYTGKIGTGILFLVLACCSLDSLLPWMIWVLDIVLIITDHYRDGNGALLEGARTRATPIRYP